MASTTNANENTALNYGRHSWMSLTVCQQVSNQPFIHSCGVYNKKREKYYKLRPKQFSPPRATKSKSIVEGRKKESLFSFSLLTSAAKSSEPRSIGTGRLLLRRRRSARLENHRHAIPAKLSQVVKKRRRRRLSSRLFDVALRRNFIILIMNFAD